MKTNNLLKGLLIVSISLLSINCLGVKPKGGGGSSSNSSKFYESFYLDGGVTQYFIKPLSLENDLSKEHSMDFITRNNETTPSGVTFNLTVYHTSTISTSDKVIFKNATKEIQGQDLKILFSEKNGEYIQNRITLNVQDKAVLELLKTPDLVISVITEGNEIKLKPTSKTHKNLVSIGESLLF